MLALISTKDLIRGRIAHGRSYNRGKAKRTLCGHWYYRTARHQRERHTNPGQDCALSLRCIHQEALLRRYPLEGWIPGCGTSGAQLGGEELSTSFAVRRQASPTRACRKVFRR